MRAFNPPSTPYSTPPCEPPSTPLHPPFNPLAAIPPIPPEVGSRPWGAAPPHKGAGKSPAPVQQRTGGLTALLCKHSFSLLMRARVKRTGCGGGRKLLAGRSADPCCISLSQNRDNFSLPQPETGSFP